MVNKINSLQAKKREIQVELNELLHSSNPDKDKINELRADILYLNKQIEKIVGKNEIERQNQLKNRDLEQEKKNKKAYDYFKDKCEKISPFNIATNLFINNANKLTIERQMVKK